MQDPVLQAIDISKSFGGVCALHSVSLSLFAGEVHALVGENGAGKSTLIRTVTGALQPDGGELRLRGEKITNNSPAHAHRLGIRVIYQQPALFPHLTVAENIGLATESGSLWRLIDWQKRRGRAQQLLDRVGARIDADQIAGSLSMPEQQLVEIAKAIETDPPVLILDEPTASLGEADVEHLFGILNRLRAQGAAILYVSHRFPELFRMADRVTVLRDGATVETRPMQGTTEADLIRLMVGRELSTVFPVAERQPEAIVFQAKGVSSRALGVADVSLSVRSGEVLGLAGLVGAGRTQVAELLFGLEPRDAGDVLLNGSRVDAATPQSARRSGIAYVPEDRRKHGVVLAMSVADNTTLAGLNQVARNGFLRLASERETALDFIRKLAVKTPSPETLAGELSGGNQQKVALARWLFTGPKLLILDEPTQGVDVGAKAEIYEIIQRLAESGTAILLISSDMHEVLGLSDRILVMRQGRIAGELSRQEATPFAVLSLALGHATERIA